MPKAMDMPSGKRQTAGHEMRVISFVLSSDRKIEASGTE